MERRHFKLTLLPRQLHDRSERWGGGGAGGGVGEAAGGGREVSNSVFET